MVNRPVVTLSFLSVAALFLLMVSANMIGHKLNQSLSATSSTAQQDVQATRNAFSRQVPTGFQSGIGSFGEFVPETPYRVFMALNGNDVPGMSKTSGNCAISVIEGAGGDFFFTINPEIVALPAGTFFMKTARLPLSGTRIYPRIVIVPESDIDFSRTNYDNTGP